jgi:chemotaxis response regulator CheB
VDSAGRSLELVRQWNPDVVLLDLMLPDNDGPELFEAFRAETDAALVGISARASVSDRIAGLKLGADATAGRSKSTPPAAKAAPSRSSSPKPAASGDGASSRRVARRWCGRCPSPVVANTMNATNTITLITTAEQLI